MPTRSLIPFTLEDFFDTYEHRADLINLASSDALPWSAADLRSKGVSLSQDREYLLQYPDVLGLLSSGFTRFCQPPEGIGVLATAGAADAIALVMHELATNDEQGHDRPIGVPRPSFGAFRGLSRMLGLATDTYDYHLSRGWTPDSEELLNLSRRCRALVVINAHNPSGQVLSHETLATLAGELASRNGILIVNEVFRVLGEAPSAIDLGSHVVVIGSLSKTYGLPGLRLGWITANDVRLKRLRTVQQYLTLSLNTLAAAFGAAVLERPREFSRAELIRDNRRILTEWAHKHEGLVSISTPSGGTTVCLTVHAAIEEDTLLEDLLKEGVLLAPGGRCFDFPHRAPWFRLGYGGDPAVLRSGLGRASTVIKRLKPSAHL